MQFIEIAPHFYINSSQILQFKLVNDPARGGFVWIFTLTTGKVLFSIPFKTEKEARIWLEENLKGLQFLSETARETHRGYKPE